MTLYKYRSFKKDTEAKRWTSHILINSELFFSGIKGFNDPFDGNVHLRFEGKTNEIRAAQYRVQYDMNLKKDDKFEGIKIEDSIKLVNDRITDDFLKNETFVTELKQRVQTIHDKKGVLALSSKNNNILMWSHYSDNHYGLCFGFEWDKNEDVYGNYKKVRYQTHYDDIWSWLHTDEEIVNRILYSKSIDWHYEKEYRIIRDTIGSEKFNPDSLKEIIFGCLMPEDDKQEIIKLTKENYPHVKFKQAVIDVEKYSINIQDY